MSCALTSGGKLAQCLAQGADKSMYAVYQDYTLRSAFQPIVAADGSLFGYEALLRIYDREGRQLKTEPFFSTGLLNVTDRLNLERLARSIHLHNYAQFLSQGALFINMTPIAALDTASQQCLQHSFMTQVTELGVSAEHIYFELLEHYTSNDRLLLHSLKNMQQHGLRIAMDDYGVDGSSETRARYVNPEVIKIDRSLLVQLRAGRPQALLDVVTLAKELKARVLVEGVESEADFESVRGIGVDYMQGYYIGHPELACYLPRHFEPVCG
ncbi:EAL domain-containing protein [Photobacterium atrarenae]|uniref:EAL domain-containing protein n=1 Tax=Photobacterium atrarenae TaxID=865757 RepID=A0ABY5GKK0_9GAMM|nr:EAL domain-containing protein [Photobacterium atrarenae]UTV29855.1 EAL domain-containing protein [Photobacterium atrarenae]